MDNELTEQQVCNIFAEHNVHYGFRMEGAWAWDWSCSCLDEKTLSSEGECIREMHRHWAEKIIALRSKQQAAPLSLLAKLRELRDKWRKGNVYLRMDSTPEVSWDAMRLVCATELDSIIKEAVSESENGQEH